MVWVPYGTVTTTSRFTRLLALGSTRESSNAGTCIPSDICPLSAQSAESWILLNTVETKLYIIAILALSSCPAGHAHVALFRAPGGRHHQQLPNLQPQRRPFLARWFCDITLRRLAKAISLGSPQARTNHSDEDSLDPEDDLPAEPVDGTSGWGAASAPTTSAVAFRDAAGIETPGAGLRVSEASRAGGASPYHFRTFTVVCTLTGVTEKGARVAEAMSPGLMVVVQDQSLACCA